MNPMWQIKDNQLYCCKTFKDFDEAMHFINAVADIARIHDHHPTIVNTYARVELFLSTHDAGNTITHKDHALADAISAIQ